MRRVRVRNLRERRASALSNVSDEHLGAQRKHDEKSRDEPNEGRAGDEVEERDRRIQARARPRREHTDDRR
jgi:hypothetical protein